MRVLVTGAYGLIGAACLARLHRDGHELIGAGRRIGEARRRFPFAGWREADFNRLTTPVAWRDVIAGVDAVVNCISTARTISKTSARTPCSPTPWRCPQRLRAAGSGACCARSTLLPIYRRARRSW